MSIQSKKKSILIVDDTQEMIELCTGMLQDEYCVTSATRGWEALQIARSLPPPDLILLDIVMPQMDGFEVAKQLKNNLLTQDIPILYLTGRSDQKSISKAFEYGANDYIRIPVSKVELLARIRNQFNLKAKSEHLKLQNEQLQDEVANRTQHLKHALSQSEALYLELNHRLKNMLQMAISLLSLHGNAINNDEAKNVIKSFIDRLHIFAMAHNLSKNEIALASIDFNKFLFHLTEYLRHNIYKERTTIHLHVNTNPQAMHINLIIPCGLFFHAAIEFLNSKAGLTPPDSIKITFDKHGADEYAMKITTSKPILQHVVDENREHFSYKLMEILALQLHGEILCDSHGIMLLFHEHQLKTYNPYPLHAPIAV